VINGHKTTKVSSVLLAWGYVITSTDWKNHHAIGKKRRNCSFINFIFDLKYKLVNMTKPAFLEETGPDDNGVYV